MDVGKIELEVDTSGLEAMEAKLADCVAQAGRLIGLMATLREAGGFGLATATAADAGEDDGEVTWELWSSNGSSIKLSEVVINRDVEERQDHNNPGWITSSPSGPLRVSAVIDGTG